MLNCWVGVAAAALACWSVSAQAQCMPGSGCSDPCGSSGCGSVVAVSSNCGGAVGCGEGYVVSSATPSMNGGPALSSVSSTMTSAPSETLCEPMITYRVIMKPTYVTESRAVCVTETQPETRYRTKTVYKTVPVTEENYRTKVVNSTQTETKSIEYTVLVPVKSEKTVELTETVPQWNEVPEEYAVRVPTLVDVPEEYTVKIPQLQDETFTYTVNVPYPVTTQKMRTVVNAVPVTKTRTVSVCIPKTTMQTVSKDAGHYEDRVEEVAAPAMATNVVNAGGCGSTGYASSATGGCSSGCSPCGSSCGGCTSGCGQVVSSGCGGCGGGVSPAPVTSYASAPACGTTTVTRRVWVPNIVTETVPVTTSTQQTREVSYTVYEQESTQIPYDCTTIAYRPETRTGSKKVVVYADETRTRTRKQVQYNEETRTRMRKELTYTSVTKSETVPYVTYQSETRSKDVTYTYNVPEYIVEPYTTTRYDQVAEEVVEEYTVNVPTTVTKEQQVQVCKMVPTLVEETVQPCCNSSSSGMIQGAEVNAGPSVLIDGCGGGAGCGGTLMVPAAPATSSGCGGCGAPVSASPCIGC